MAIEDTLSTLANNVADLVRTLSGTSGGNSAGGSSSGSAKSGSDAGLSGLANGVSKATEAVTPLVFGLNRLTTGADTSATALGLFQTGLSKVGLDGLGAAAKMSMGTILDWKTQLDAAAKDLGVGANNIGLFVRMAGDAGVTTKQFTDILAQSGAQSMGLGANAQKGAAEFSKIAESVRGSPVGQYLQDLGMSTQELGSITALSAIQTRKAGLDTKDAAASAQQLAIQLDETSRLTGVSREQMAKNLAADEKRPEIRALENLMAREQIEGYQKTKRAAETMGQGMVQLTSELASGKLSKEGQNQMALLGEAGREYEAALRQQMAVAQTGTKEQKDAADAALQVAQAHVAAKLASKEMAAAAVYSDGEQGRAAKGLIDSYQGMENVQRAAAEFQKKGMSEQDAYVAAFKQNTEDMKKQREGRKEDGTRDEGQNAARLLNAANQQAAIQAQGLAINFEKLNNSIKPGTPIYEGLSRGTKFVGDAGSGAEAATAQRAAPKKAEEALLGSGTRPASAAPATDLDSSGNPLPYKAKGVPARGEGGIIQGPELAVIAEKGPEAVIPLDKMSDVMGAGDKAAGTAAEISGVAAATGKGDLEMVLSDYQKTVLQYAKTEGEMKQTQLDNERSIILGKEAQITEAKQRIADIEKTADGRELTQREQNRIQKINDEIKGFEQEKATSKEALAVYENLDKLKAQTSIDAKKAELAETVKTEDAKKTATVAQQAYAAMATIDLTENQKKMFGELSNMSKEDSDKKKISLAEEYASAVEANKAALAARDAIEEKAELEGRKMTEAEEAQYKALGLELNSSSKRIDAAKDAQKVMERAETTVSSMFAPKIVDQAAADAQKVMERAETTVSSMFAPKIVDQAAADAQKAKLAFENSKGQVKEASKTTEAVPKKSDADIKKEAEAKAEAAKKASEGKKDTTTASPAKAHEATLKDLNDQLILLNKHMVQLINHSEKSADANAKTARATEKSTGVR